MEWNYDMEAAKDDLRYFGICFARIMPDGKIVHVPASEVFLPPPPTEEG